MAMLLMATSPGTPPPPPPPPRARAARVCRALDQLDGDVGRVDLSEQWRPYSRLSMQQPEGPPLTKIQKLRVRGRGPSQRALCSMAQVASVRSFAAACALHTHPSLWLQESLAAHLPAAEHPAEVGAFLDRVQQQIQARWRVSLPPGGPHHAAGAAAPVALPGAMQQQAAAMPKLDDPEGYDLPSRQQFSMAVPGMLKQE